MRLRDLRALIIDMDGVLYRGNVAIPGAVEFLDWLAERQFPFVLLTNNATLHPEDYARKLAKLGMRVPADRILTSAVATAGYLARNFAPETRVFIIGEGGLERCIAERGFTITDQNPDVVVVGLDRQVTYEKLSTATLAIQAGAHFVATNPDRTLPTERGELPGAGALVAAIVAATDREPVVIGKPETAAIETALDWLQQPRERTAMLGDRLETDILGAQRAKLPTILVLTGITREPPPESSSLRPTWVWTDLKELRDAWEREYSS